MKKHRSSVLLCGLLLALGSFGSTLHHAQAGTDGKPAAKPDGYYHPYGSVDNTYDNIEEVNPHGAPFNKWLSRLFESRSDARQRGWIRVGSPQVYSRQLVYRDRAEEIQFLSERLKATKTFDLKFQGAVDSRFYTALASQLALSIDPASGKVLDQNQRNLLQQSQNQETLLAVQQEVTLLNLKQQLALATNTLAEIQEQGKTASGPAVVDEQTKQRVASLEAEVAALKEKIASQPVPLVGAETNRALPQKDTTGKPTSEVLTEGGSAANTAKSELTAIEEEKGILEVRRFLQNERRRLSFDDLHDSSGSITLELGMLVTLMPPENANQYAVLEISVEKPDGKDDQSYDYEHLMERWADYLGPAIQMECDFISTRYDSLGALPYTEKFLDIAHKKLVMQQYLKKQNSTYEGLSPEKQVALQLEIVGLPSFVREQSQRIGIELPGSNSGMDDTTAGTSGTAASTRTGKDGGGKTSVEKLLKSFSPRTNMSLISKEAMGSLDHLLMNSPLSADMQTLTNPSRTGEKAANLLPQGSTTTDPGTTNAAEPPPPVPSRKDREKKKKEEDEFKRKMLLFEYLSTYYGSDFMPLYLHYAATGKLPAGKEAEAFKFLNWSDKGVKVLSVDPAEQAQNISMLGATQSIRNTVFSLNAMLSGGVAGSARADHYRDSQLFMDSVNRKPIAVGFVNGAYPDPSFGWILGPRFQVEMKRRWYQFGFLGEKRPIPTFAHEPITHQVQVVISLPTWIPKLMLKVKAHWVDKTTGLPSKPLQTPLVYNDDWNLADPARRSYTEAAARIPVHLEPDYAALTEGLLDYVHGKRRPPRIFLQHKDEKFNLTTNGTKHHLVLLGKDLWRTPTVYLDSMPAATVDVMPGLNGIVATFEGDLPDTQDKYYNVTVSTDGGFDTIRDIVGSPTKIKTMEKAETGAATPLLSLSQKVFVHDYTADIDDAKNALAIPFKVEKNPYPFPPQKYLDGKLRLPSPSLNPDDFRPGTLGYKNGSVLLSPVPTATAKKLADLMPGLDKTAPAIELISNISMTLVDEATQDIHQKNVIQGNYTVILLKNEDSRTFTIKGATTDPQPYDLSKIPAGSFALAAPNSKLFAQAYPEYATALDKGTLQIQLGDKKVTVAQTSPKDPTFPLPNAKQAEDLGVKADGKPVPVIAKLVVPGLQDAFAVKQKLAFTLPAPPTPDKPATPDKP